MKPSKHPEKYNSYVATEAAQNSTIAASMALLSVAGPLAIEIGAIVANPQGAPADDAPIADMIAEGVDQKAPYYLQVKIDGQFQNQGLMINAMREALANNPPNPLEAFARIHPGKTQAELIAMAVLANPSVLAALNAALSTAMSTVIAAE